MLITILFFVGFIVAVLLGQKFKVNAGFIAIAFGFILTWIFGGADAATSSTFISSFPITLFWNYTMPVIFYAFANANGTLEVLGKKIAYAFRNARWALPFAILLIAAVVAAAGAGTMNTFIIAPLAWGLCISAGVTPMIVPVALWCGSFVGAFLPWTSNGSLWAGMFTEYLGITETWGLSLRVDIYYIIMAVCFLAVMYIITKAWRTKDSDSNNAEFMAKPGKFSNQQLATLIIILTCIGSLLIPSILNMFIDWAPLEWMSDNLAIPVTSAIAITIVAILGGCNMKEVFSKHVNWHMIFLITGMAMYCGLASTLGVVDTLSNALTVVPAALVSPLLCLIGSALSFVTSASTVQPLLMAMIPALSAASGLSYEALVIPMMLGVGVTSFSPISTGGAACLIGCPEEISQKLFNKMLICAVILMIAAALISATPLVRIGL